MSSKRWDARNLNLRFMNEKGGLGIAAIMNRKSSLTVNAPVPVMLRTLAPEQEALPATKIAMDANQAGGVRQCADEPDVWTLQNQQDYHGNIYSQIAAESRLKEQVAENHGSFVEEWRAAHAERDAEKQATRYKTLMETLAKFGDPEYDSEVEPESMEPIEAHERDLAGSREPNNSSRANNESIFTPIEFGDEADNTFMRGVMDDDELESPDLSRQSESKFDDDDIGNMSFKTITKEKKLLTEGKTNSLLRRLGPLEEGKQQYLDMIREMRNIANEQNEKSDHYMSRMSQVYEKYHPKFNGKDQRKPQMKTMKSRLHKMATTLEHVVNFKYSE
jgi:hypothetical protein